MKILILISFLYINLIANPLDTFHLIMSKVYENFNNKSEAFLHYQKIEDKPDSVTYNIANMLYEQKKYQEAIERYKKITEPSLQFNKFYNLGNSYAKSNMYEDAIKAYEQALKIKDDNDAKSNLEIVKKYKKRQDQNEKKRNKDYNKGLDGNSIGKSQEDLGDNPKRDNQIKNKQAKAKNTSSKDNKNNERANANYERTQQGELPTTQNQIKGSKNKESQKLRQALDIEEKKWLNTIGKQEFNTIMIPLNKNGAKNDKTINPW